MERLKKCLSMYEKDLDPKARDNYAKRRYCHLLLNIQNRFIRPVFRFHSCFFLPSFSHEFEIIEHVLEQRLTHVELEYEQKYNAAKEQLKNDSRLTIDAIVQYDGKSTH